MIMLLTMICAAMVLTAFAGPAYADQHGKTVFLTIASFNGNLGGLTGADEKCQAEADGPASIVPSGAYLAWLLEPRGRIEKPRDLLGAEHHRQPARLAHGGHTLVRIPDPPITG